MANLRLEVAGVDDATNALLRNPDRGSPDPSDFYTTRTMPVQGNAAL